MATSEPVEINWPEGMDEEERENLRGALIAYDEALKDFEADHRIVFPSDAERNRQFYGFLKKSAKAWAKPGPCMYDGCTKTSIPRSHTISLSSSIRLIAENNHVVTPQFREGVVELVSVGVREASTFPGFCDEHEALFSDFETKKQMTTAEHFGLQAFRTVCREIYTKRHHRKRTEELRADYRKLREEYVVGRLKKAHTGTQPFNVSGLRFENDPIETKFVEALNDIQTDLPQLENLYRAILNDLQNGTDGVAMFVQSLDVQLPVCLSGLGVLNYMDKDVRKRALCFLAIIPEAGDTKIMLGATSEHEGIVRLHFHDKSSPAFLERLESWMIYGSDHWFMTPSAWAAIPEGRQRAIREELLETLSLADPVPFSLLDGLRKQIVSLIEQQLASGAIPSQDIVRVKELLDREEAKLAYVAPPRETTENTT